MDRFGPITTGKVSKKRIHLLRWTTFPGRTGWNFVEWIAPSDLKLFSDACYLGEDPPQCWMRLRAKMLPAMHRREIPR